MSDTKQLIAGFEACACKENHGCHPEGCVCAWAEDMAAALASKDAEIERLKRAVVTFAGPHALRWACEFGLPDGHLHPKHYDLLAECGARVDDFVRAELPNQAAGPTPQPRNEVSGSETPGDHSGDLE